MGGQVAVAQTRLGRGGDLHLLWRRGSNENTDGLLRQYFPEGTDLNRHRQDDLDAIAHTLSTRPRKSLAWKTPAKAFNDHLNSLHATGVATTD